MTPDPYMATANGATNPTDPQSWNRYAYAGSDPVNRLDPTGEDWCAPDDLFCYSFDTVPDLGDIIYGLNFDFSALAAQIAAQVQAAMQGVNRDILASTVSAFTDEQDARADLAKDKCYKLLGFTSATAAQSWFDRQIKFNYASYGKLNVPGRGPTADPAPANTLGYGTININTDYNWADFSKVSTQQGGTFNYLAYINRGFRTNMNSEQLGTLIILHELGHQETAPKQPSNAENAAEKIAIYNDCIK